MSKKNLINQLELAYAPITAYEFAANKSDVMIERALAKASLYVIAQRPVITFENVTFNEVEYHLNFEIHQQGNLVVLRGELPLIQKAVGSSNDDTIAVAFNYLDKSTQQDGFPFMNIHAFSLVHRQKDSDKFLIWFSPEKLLQNWWKGNIECKIEGDFRTFTKYKVHYVGKATKQSILKRLTGHSTFQDILSLQTPVTKKQLPANEIVILPFEFQENLQFQTFDSESDINDMVSALKGENWPQQEKIFLDVEKAFVNSMKPAYNKQLFNSYPVSTDGLYESNYHMITYTLIDPISLVYDKGEISGGQSLVGGDQIVVLNGQEVRLYKHN